MRLLPWFFNSVNALALGCLVGLIYLEIHHATFGSLKSDEFATAAVLSGIVATLFGVGFGYRAGRRDERNSALPTSQRSL